MMHEYFVIIGNSLANIHNKFHDNSTVKKLGFKSIYTVVVSVS